LPLGLKAIYLIYTTILPLALFAGPLSGIEILKYRNIE
jgi:hypothetical protein